jgi:hypothetical protein
LADSASVFAFKSSFSSGLGFCHLQANLQDIK